MSETWQRARQPEQKEIRSESILEAAASLLDADGLQGTGLNAIARAAGISKANTYRYFESREAVLMELLLREHRELLSTLEHGFHTLKASNDASAVAEVIASALSSRSRYCILVSALGGILEHNVSSETIAKFKRQLIDSTSGTIDALEAAIPKLSKEALFDYLTFIIMAASGVWPHSHPSKAAQQVLESPEFSQFRIEFQETMTKRAEDLLVGLMAKA